MQQLSLHKVRFLPMGRIVSVEDGANLLKTARQAGVHINASCGGSGVCGKCRVFIEEGAVNGGHSERLSEHDLQAGVRQACLASVHGDVTIRIPQESMLDARNLDTKIPERHKAQIFSFNINDLQQQGIFSPPVEKLFLELPVASQNDNMADASRLARGLKEQYNEQGLVMGLATLRKLRAALRADNFRVTVTLARPVRPSGKTIVVNVQAGDWTKRNFGLAFDIGTTTVYGQLVDLNTGSGLAEGGEYNAQISYGEDVISRIVFGEKQDGLKVLQEQVIRTMNKIIVRLLKATAIEADEIDSITVAGNTTMTHFFLGLEADNIRRAPYVPVSIVYPPVRATDLGLALEDHAVALVYPAISSYVGGDIVAGVMGSGMYQTEALTLYIDIGTNAEIVIGNKEWLACAACSAGPAFEGGGITHGMRAAPGAIEDFDLNPVSLEPMNLTIGNKPPIGICGSGLLILVATLFEHGVIEPDGRFNPSLQTPRIRKGKNGVEYVLVWKEEIKGESDISINEVDIQNFIRAKAAIYAGIKTLVEEVGLRIGDLEQIILAGAFGSYIDLDCAMMVGLLPEVDTHIVKYVGNGSLMGARMNELSNHIRRDVLKVVHRMTSFELSEVDTFKDRYVASLFLPHTDTSLFPRTAERLIKNRRKEF